MAELAPNNPNMLRLIAEGLRAQNQLQAVEGGPAMKLAVNDAQTPYGDVQGEGFASQAPGLLNLIATVAQRRQGQGRVNALNEQAKVLRGQGTEGTLAELQAKQARYDREMALKQEGEDRKASQFAQELASREGQGQASRDNALTIAGMRQAPTVHEKFVPRVNPDDKKTYMVTEKGGEAFLEGQPIPNYSLWGVPQREGKTGTGKPSTQLSKDAMASIATLKMANEVRAIADTFTPQDEAQLKKAFSDVAVKKITPDSLDVYVQNNLRGYSPKVKKYLMTVARGSAEVRNNLSGATVTQFEGKSNNAFMPNEPGLTLRDQMRRVGDFANTSHRKLEAIDEVLGSEHSKRYSKWAEWNYPGAANPGGIKPRATDQTGVPAADPNIEAAIQATLKEIEELKKQRPGGT